MSVLWLVPYGDNRGGVVERNGSICANNLHKQSPSSTTGAEVYSCAEDERFCDLSGGCDGGWDKLSDIKEC